jgi:hypothetical protein
MVVTTGGEVSPWHMQWGRLTGWVVCVCMYVLEGRVGMRADDEAVVVVVVVSYKK